MARKRYIERIPPNWKPEDSWLLSFSGTIHKHRWGYFCLQWQGGTLSLSVGPMSFRLTVFADWFCRFDFLIECPEYIEHTKLKVVGGKGW